MKKAVFLDIDGTLLGQRDGRAFVIPDSAVDAVRRLRAAGHLAAICTGRQAPFIRKYFPGLFDSYIAMNGTHVVCDGKTIFQEFYSTEQIRKRIAYFDAFGASYNFIGNEHGWARNLAPGMAETLDRIYSLDDYIKTDWRPEDVRAGAMDFIFTDKAHYDRCRPAFTGSMILNLHPNGLSGDLTFPGHDKATAIRRFCEYAGIGLEDTVAFGDGYNDVTMLRTAGVGVAMGNAVPAAKQAADLVTDSLFDDGVANGLRRLGLI